MRTFILFLFLLMCACGETTSSGNFKGASCTVVTNTQGVLLTCPGSDPVQINNGLAGLQGPQGDQGLTGSDGTSIKVIQFCPGFTPRYPTSFPEVGFCIANILYGVYWANTAFLAPLPPGTYASTSLANTKCSFTITTGCSIQ